MNKLLVIYASAAISGTPTADEQKHGATFSEPIIETVCNDNMASEAFPGDDKCEKPLVDLATIEFVEVEAEIALGFDTAIYLPKGFDVYGAPANIHAIDFIGDQTVELGFDTKPYLPNGYSPYEVNVHAIEFIAEDEQLDLDAMGQLSTTASGFQEQYMDIHAVDFIESDEVELGFDTNLYLSEDFDPYAGLD